MKPPGVFKSDVSGIWFAACDQCPNIEAAYTEAEIRAKDERHQRGHQGRAS